MKTEFKIYVEHNDSRSNDEAELKGWRGDIYVKISYEFYQLTVITPGRLSGEFEEQIKKQGYYSIDNNLILLPSVNFNEIKKVLGGLYKDGYFAGLLPIPADQIVKLNLQEIE